MNCAVLEKCNLDISRYFLEEKYEDGGKEVVLEYLLLLFAAAEVEEMYIFKHGA